MRRSRSRCGLPAASRRPRSPAPSSSRSPSWLSGWCARSGGCGSPGIGLRDSPEPVIPERLDQVMAVLYLIFNEGYSASSGDAPVRQELCAEAIRLARVLAEPAAGRARAGGARRAHALPPCPRTCADRGRRRADPARRPGSAVVGRATGRPGRGGASQRRGGGMGRRLLPSGGDLTRARAGRLGRRHRLAGDRRTVRRPRRGGAVAGRRAEPGGGGLDERGARGGARAPRPAGAPRRRSPSTTCCRRPGPTCSAGLGAPPRRWPSTGARSSSRPGRPTGRSCLGRCAELQAH